MVEFIDESKLSPEDLASWREEKASAIAELGLLQASEGSRIGDVNEGELK